MNDLTKERADFEAAYLAHYGPRPRVRSVCEAEWRGWQLARAALSTPAQAVPGFVLVPVEPTRQMYDAGGDVDGTPDKLLRAIYQAMLAAAPAGAGGRQPLATVEARYKDLLQQLGVQGHDGAVAEIGMLRKARGLGLGGQGERTMLTDKLAKALEDYKHACFGYAQDQSEHTARRMTAAKEACLAAAQAAAEPAGEAVPAGHVAWVVSKPGGYKDVGYQSSVLNKLPHGTLLYAKPQHASGSFMTREQAIAHCRERRPGIEPTEQHIAATIDAYAALFGDFAPTAPAAEPLTDEQIKKLYALNHWHEMAHFTWGAASVVVRAIERAHGIGASGGEVRNG